MPPNSRYQSQHLDGDRDPVSISSRRRVLRMLGLGLPVAFLNAWTTRRLGAQGLDEGPRSKTQRVNGVTLHYLEWGSESARPMVLLHPAPLNARVWDHFGRAMARSFRVIAPDARGFGDSEWSDSYEGDVFLDDLSALIGALRLDRPVLCGNSMGGTLAYMYAGLYPNQVERLILVDTGHGEPPPASNPDGAPPAKPAGPPRPPPGPFKSVEDASSQMPPIMGPAFNRAMVEHNLKRTADGTWVWKYDHSRVWAASARSASDPRKWPLWEAVRCPTLVLRGERSPAMSQQAAERMVAANRNAVLVVVPGAGHFIPIEAPAAFEAAVRQWLG